LIFFEFFEPQTVFIGGWDIKFIFLDFFDLKQLKNNQICIQTIKFKFKLINQKMTPHYRPNDSVRSDFNAGATARFS
jgi:hypothetical protein